MKRGATLTAAAALLLAGCIYDAPLVQEDRIAIDPDLLGRWELAGENGEQPLQALILEYSNTEYLVQYSVPDGPEIVDLYFRGYPIELGGMPCVQLQLIGIESEPPPADADDKFVVVSYRANDDRLTVRVLNEKLVARGLETTKELQKAFLEHRADPDLFVEPGIFKRIAD